MAKKQRPPKQARSKGKTRGSDPNKWWDQAEEVPRAGLPDAERLNKRAKRLRRFVWATVFLSPFLALTSMVALSSMMAGPDETPNKPSDAEKYAETRSTAIVAVREWLAQDPAPLPGGVFVDWDNATSTDVDPEPTETGDEYAIETHTMTLAGPGGALYETVVTLAVSDTIGVTPLGEPSLVPKAPSDTSFSESMWPGMDTVLTTDAVEAAIANWAAAYSSGDPSALRLAVQDPEEARFYVPLVGAQLVEPDVRDSVGVWPKDYTLAQREDTAPPRMIVQVAFRILWNGTGPEDPAANDAAVVTYDLLVDHADTAAPVVVAWGGPGTGPSLKQYGNAITGRSVEVEAPEPDATALPEPDAVPSSDPSGDPSGEPSGAGTDKTRKEGRR